MIQFKGGQKEAMKPTFFKEGRFTGFGTANFPAEGAPAGLVLCSHKSNNDT